MCVSLCWIILVHSAANAALTHVHKDCADRVSEERRISAGHNEVLCSGRIWFEQNLLTKICPKRDYPDCCLQTLSSKSGLGSGRRACASASVAALKRPSLRSGPVTARPLPDRPRRCRSFHGWIRPSAAIRAWHSSRLSASTSAGFEIVRRISSRTIAVFRFRSR
jgi:hypothetical protein